MSGRRQAILERIYTPPAGKGRVRASVYIRLLRSVLKYRGYVEVQKRHHRHSTCKECLPPQLYSALISQLTCVLSVKYTCAHACKHIHHQQRLFPCPKSARFVQCHRHTPLLIPALHTHTAELSTVQYDLVELGVSEPWRLSRVNVFSH